MPNRLADESSLYLRQHADNPVDWHGWNAETLAVARRERKPILLSIGYSACHWCHVMAHESFEDAATARVMNEFYVNIKVDREERPDLDKIYQLAHQALSRRGGGWPLTVFLSPEELIPFYAGTYFPPQARHGLPSFVEVLRGVRRWFDEHPQELAQQNAALGEFLAEYGHEHAPLSQLDDAPVHAARQHIAASFDDEHGGHRGGPKFPPATELELLRRLARHGDEEAAAMATLTLHRMAERGLHDHLAGGFFRYCVDAHWGIPHFEKMLYDNAALLALYADAGADADEPEFQHAAAGIVRWLQDEMRLDGGGYASALDADSEGEEGRYYVWRREEVGAALAQSDHAEFFAAYGLDAEPNFENHAWHLQRNAAFEPRRSFASERETLRRLRAQRVPPARDDKRLTSWNAMLLRALARAAASAPRDGSDTILSPALSLKERERSRAALRERNGKASTALLPLLQGEGRGEDGVAPLTLANTLLTTLREHAWHDGQLYALAPIRGARVPGFLDDYAFLLDALIEHLQVQWRDDTAFWAQQLADRLLRDFEDRKRGGFWFTPHAHEALPQRPKPWFDEATPSGNAVAARALLRLGHLLGEPRWLDAAERALRAGIAATRDAPHGACALIEALHEFLRPPVVVVLRAEAQEAAAWAAALSAARRAGAQVYVLGSEAAALAEKAHRAGGAAYVCVGMRCLEPVTTPADLAPRLEEAT